MRRVGSFQWKQFCDYPNFDFDIKQIDEDSLNGKTANFACGQSCLLNPNCKFYVYNPTTTTCSLKNATRIQEVQTSGPNFCGMVNNRGNNPVRNWRLSANRAYYWDINCDFSGSDIANNASPSKTFALCGMRCMTNKDCNYFTFSKKTSLCFLKKANFMTAIKNTEGAACGFIPSRQQFKVETVINDV